MPGPRAILPFSRALNAALSVSFSKWRRLQWKEKGASFFYMQHNFCDSINTSGAVGNKRLKN